MRISEILKESEEFKFKNQFNLSNTVHNSEAESYAERNRERHRKVFKDFDETGVVPVFYKEESKEEKFSNKPAEGTRQSAGHRGIEYLRRLAGLTNSRDSDPIE